MRDPATFATGAKFTLQGHEFQVVEDGDGLRLLKDGDDHPIVPADHVGKIPIDKGSLTKAPAATPTASTEGKPSETLNAPGLDDLADDHREEVINSLMPKGAIVGPPAPCTATMATGLHM